MSHAPINEETLVLYYYDDGLSREERRRVEKEIEKDEGLREQYEALSADLDALRQMDDIPAPEGLEYRLQSSLERAIRLDEAEAQPRSWLSNLFGGGLVAAGTALAAILAVGIGIGIWVAGEESPAPQVVIQTPTQQGAEWSQTAFQRGLETHFRTGRSSLASLADSEQQDREALVSALITQNRLFARLATENGSPELARVLRAFEATLVELASEDLSPGEAAALKDQLEFEYQVMLTKLARATSEQTKTQNQEIEL